MANEGESSNLSGSINEHFVAQVSRTPDSVAISMGENRLTYRELNSRANQLARELIRAGVRPEDPVAVLMQRSVELVTATLATLKAGAHYLPLHSAYPLERMQGIVDSARPTLLLTDRAMRDRGLPHTENVLLADESGQPTPDTADDPGLRTDPKQLAYVMHTSGSTGAPKGVAVTQHNVLELASEACWNTGAHQRVLMVAPYAFDVSTYEMWVPLLNGGQVVVAPARDLDVATLRREIANGDVTAVHLTAGLFRLVAEEAPDTLKGVSEVMTGGDVVSPHAVERVLESCPDIVVRALYGPTETTLFATHTTFTSPYTAGSTVPIGHPMSSMRAYVLDEELRPVADEVVGELHLGGTGVARGYAGRPDLTAERFVADPFAANGDRMYRTGDLVRRTPDGLLDFLGRTDDQVKVRGFRVEPAEVASVVARHADVRDVAVVPREVEPGDIRLAAYVVPRVDDIDLADVRHHVERLLPGYMVPADFVPLDALPLTANGKIDHASLPGGTTTTVDERAPEPAHQATLTDLFRQALGVDQVGVDDNFFDLGGQSIQAMRLMVMVEAKLGVELTIDVLFDAPTVALLARRLEQEESPQGA